MRVVLLFLSCLCLATTASNFKALSEVSNLTIEDVNKFFDNFGKVTNAFLDSQRPSIASPFQEVINCVEDNLEDVKKSVNKLLIAFTNDKSLEDRKKLCQDKKFKIIDKVHRCIDKHVAKKAQPFINTFRSVIYLPYHELCTYETPTQHLVFVQGITREDLSKRYRPSYDKYVQYLETSEAPSKEDECLPFILSTAYDKVMRKSNIFDPLSRGLFEQSLRVYFMMKAKFPFRSFSECFDELKKIKPRQ